MPTDNPKVSGYVPQVLKDRLTQFREERKISESQAVTIILAEYFGIEQEIKESFKGVEVGGVTLMRLEMLERKVAELAEIVSQKSRLLSEPDTVLENEPLQLKIETSSTDLEPATVKPSIEPEKNQFQIQPEPLLEFQPISGRQLSEFRFGMNKSSVAGAKRERSTERFIAWTKMKDPDGIGWKPVEAPEKGYIPASELPSELLSKLNKWIAENIS